MRGGVYNCKGCGRLVGKVNHICPDKVWNKGNIAYNKICKNCFKEFKVSRKERVFCSKNCFINYWDGKQKWGGERKEISIWLNNNQFKKGVKSFYLKDMIKNNPEKAKEMFNKIRESNIKNGHYKRIKERMLNGGAIKARMGNELIPNKPEMFLINLFSEYNIPLDYVGDGEFWIRDGELSFNPDFIDRENKIILEFDGKYWHKDNKKDITRNKVYNKLGYKLIIMNEDNISNKIIALNKIGEIAK